MEDEEEREERGEEGEGEGRGEGEGEGEGELALTREMAGECLSILAKTGSGLGSCLHTNGPQRQVG